MQKFSRAQRRSDCQKISNKRKHHWGFGINGWRGNSEMMSSRQSGIVLNTPTPCSCWMCNNPRRSSRKNTRLTLQELKALDNYQDQINDL